MALLVVDMSNISDGHVRKARLWEHDAHTLILFHIPWLRASIYYTVKPSEIINFSPGFLLFRIDPTLSFVALHGNSNQAWSLTGKKQAITLKH